MNDEMNKMCANLLEKTLSKLFLMEYNHALLENKLLHEINDLGKMQECLDIVHAVTSIKMIDNVEQKQKAIENLLNLKYKGSILSDFFEITEKNNKLLVKSKTKEVSFKEIYSRVHEYWFHKEALDLNLSNYCKNLFTLYEIFYVELSKVNCFLYPDIFFKDKNLTYNELKSFDFDKNMASARLMEKVTKGLTQRSTKLQDVCEFLHVDYSAFGYLKDDFDEIYYRRNILTHGDGFVSEDYKNVVKSELRKKYIKNNRLIYTEDYENVLYETIVLVIFQLFISTIYKNEVNNHDLVIIASCIYNVFYEKKNWRISKILYSYLRKLKFSDDCSYKEVFTVNYLCCLKFLHEDFELKKQLRLFNVSSMSEEFKLAKMLISDNYENINDKIEKIYIGNEQKDGFISAQKILTWPLFQDYIKTEHFVEFKKRHINDFKTYIPE